MAAPELTGELLDQFNLVTKRFEQAKKCHDSFRQTWEHLFGLYRGYQEFKTQMRAADRPDRDTGLREARKVFGTDLFIPYSFATVETILPRAISNRPKMLILPDGKASVDNVENMKQLIDRQQEQIAYELKLGDTAKSGFIFGLGIQRTGWRQEFVTTRQWEQPEVPTAEAQWQVSKPFEKLVFDDPDAYDVDIFNFFWDPFGFDIPSCRYVIERSYRDTTYVMGKINRDEWNNPLGLTWEDIRESGPSEPYDESVSERQKLAGQPEYDLAEDDLHGLLEYHDRDTGQIVTVIDQKWPINITANPYWHGELPYQAFRPSTAGLKQLPGIGEIEPIEQLQIEVNQLRSQRRDNAALKLMQVFAFHDGFVDKSDLQWFPGAAIPVNGDPREMLLPVQVGDIPNSGYQEEANLQADIERTTGISDPVAGTGDASQTATGVQLVQAAANVRIAQKTRRIEVELCAPAARQWVSLNQQHILERQMEIVAEPTALEPNRRWRSITLTPAELAGTMIVIPDGGAIAPEDKALKRNDALFLANTFRGDPTIDQRVLYRAILEYMDIKNPDMWLTPEQRVPPIVLDILAEDFGVPVEILQQAVEMGVMAEEAMANGEAPEGLAEGELPPEQNGKSRITLERGADGRVSGAVRE